MAHFGGLCNYFMNSSTTPQILAFLEKEVGHLPFQRIQEFIRMLSPALINSNLDLFESFYRAILAEYQIRATFSKDFKMQEVASYILSIANKVNQQLLMVLKNILHNPTFLESIKKSIEKNQVKPHTVVISNPSKETISPSSTEASKTGVNAVQSKAKTAFNFEVIKGPKYQQSNSKLLENKQTQICYNLESKPQCICLNQREIVTKDEFSFKCAHCFKLFHTVCFKRKPNSQYCCYCYIEKMIPVKKVVKTAYLGLMRKNVKKHCANFVVPFIQPNQRLQVRCLRLKDGAQTSCLFPDVAEIIINSHRVKEFEPINKQSCLKYRKDEPFMLIKGDYFPGQDNSLILNEAVSTNKEKQIRYQSQNHIFGIFVVEDLKIQSLISQMKVQSVMGFSESKTILFDSFRLGKGDDQITCELVKIPLSCPLLTSRIDIPARGIFCTHFQCFDLKNYLTLVSQSQNPRWKCPLCPNLAYQLQIDSIVQEILKQTKENPKIQQILFFKNGDYAPIIDDQPVKQRKNIINLNIPQKRPKHEPPVIEQAPVKKQFLVPVNAEVIELDD